MNNFEKIMTGLADSIVKDIEKKKNNPHFQPTKPHYAEIKIYDNNTVKIRMYPEASSMRYGKRCVNCSEILTPEDDYIIINDNFIGTGQHHCSCAKCYIDEILLKNCQQTEQRKKANKLDQTESPEMRTDNIDIFVDKETLESLLESIRKLYSMACWPEPTQMISYSNKNDRYTKEGLARYIEKISKIENRVLQLMGVNWD